MIILNTRNIFRKKKKFQQKRGPHHNSNRNIRVLPGIEAINNNRNIRVLPGIEAIFLLVSNKSVNKRKNN